MNRSALASLVLALTVLGCPASDDPETSDSVSPQTSAATAVTGSETAGGGSSGNSAIELGCAANAVGDTGDGASDARMENWGSACTADAQCVARLGEGAVCDLEAVIYELPGGYCTKPCTLPAGVTAIADDPTCDPDGGVACIGSMSIYERCAVICTDDQQCDRDGYICRIMPMIGADEDPKTCLMPDCCQESCAE